MRERRAAASAASALTRSTVYTSAAMRDSTAAPYPEPVPISRTRTPGLSRAAAVIAATMYGWEMVWPCPMGSGPSWYARSTIEARTKHSRGTSRIACSTSGSVMPRATSWAETMRRRPASRIEAPPASIPDSPLLGLDRDRRALRRGSLGQGDGQHTVLDGRGDLAGLHRRRQPEAPGERAVGALDAMVVLVSLLPLLALLPLDREQVLLQGHLQV